MTARCGRKACRRWSARRAVGSAMIPEDRLLLASRWPSSRGKTTEAVSEGDRHDEG
jgi:hypothetical protein